MIEDNKWFIIIAFIVLAFLIIMAIGGLKLMEGMQLPKLFGG